MQHGIKYGTFKSWFYERQHTAAQVAFIPAELSELPLPGAATSRVALLLVQDTSLAELMAVIKAWLR